MDKDFLHRGMNGANQMAGEVSAWVGEMPQYGGRTESRTVGLVTTIYKAWAPYGSATNAPVWMVQRIVIDETLGLDMTDELAGGVAGAFGFTWDDRATHTYS